MEISADDIAAIQSFGYTETEARFLYIVATHSGYFVARQFLEFSGAHWGYRTNHFVEKLQRHGHVYWREYFGVGRVYHLFSKPIYEVIGKETIRNRRRHATEFIKTRLLTLDFILANQRYRYLETETEKLSYFCDQLQFHQKYLPCKRYSGGLRTQPSLCYFVDKFPLYLDSSANLASPVVTFS